MEFTVRAVAFVRGSRTEPTDDGWDDESTTLVLAQDVPDDALVGLGEFSHVEVVLLADRASDVPPAPWRRRSRGRADRPEMGVFAQRNKDRPNRLLVSVARVRAVRAREVDLAGLDAIDGTPVLDIKPVYRWGGPRGSVDAPEWTDELGAGYF
jgi:tRNA (adenine37-N6)-methyltransferase